jgi:hypothetical protein
MTVCNKDFLEVAAAAAAAEAKAAQAEVIEQRQRAASTSVLKHMTNFEMRLGI